MIGVVVVERGRWWCGLEGTEKAGRVVRRIGLLAVAAAVYSVADSESFPRALEVL
jgi:hypothetical protein